MNSFKLEILSQDWMSPGDFSSHGRINAVIGGTVVSTTEPVYGITQSALSLLRSLERDHPPDNVLDELPIAGYLLCHDCGYPLGLGCDNFGTDWRVQHDRGDVILSDVRMFGSGSRRIDIEARVPIAEYRRKIVWFAREARRFYFADGPNWNIDIQPCTTWFWADFDERFNAAELAASND